jgi:hypothetical protein
MKTLLWFIIVVCAAGSAGCIVFTERPESELVAGRVIWAGSDRPVAAANVTIWEARNFVTLFPVSYPAAARTQSDGAGLFSVQVVNEWPARATASTPCGFGEAMIGQGSLQDVSIEVKPQSGEGCPDTYERR